MSYIGLTRRPEQMAWFIYRNIAWSVSVAIHAFGRQSLVWLKPKIVQNKMPHSAPPMVITATVAPPCGRGGLDTFAYSMYCEWQVYKAVFCHQTYDIYQCNYVVLTC